MKIRRYIAHYLYGLGASGYNAGITAVVSFLGLAGGQAAGIVAPDTAKMSPVLLWSIFKGAWALHSLLYLYQHRLPETLPDDVVKELVPGDTKSPFASQTPQVTSSAQPPVLAPAT